jgi:hypothetical protein
MILEENRPRSRRIPFLPAAPVALQGVSNRSAPAGSEYNFDNRRWPVSSTPNMRMGSEPERNELRIPDWVQAVLKCFEGRTEPYNEVQIADALGLARKNQGDLNDQDWRGFLAERSAFFFTERPNEDSIWGTYFAPMGSWTLGDGTPQRSPDIKDLDADVVAHWERRARSVHSPVMRARYADLVWDLTAAITKGHRPHEYALIAIDAYIDATEKSYYTIEIEAAGWLKRALNLALSVGDKDRQRRAVDAIFALYDRVAVADPHLIGVWTFPFDVLYDKKDLLAPEQESRLIADLEAMLVRTSGAGKAAEFDPFGAQAASDRLARYYKRHNNRAEVERVIKTYGQAFAKISKEASPMLAMAWLQPVIERYEQEGLKADAEQLQLMSAEKGKNVASDLKEVSTKVELKKEDVDKVVEHLISGDLKTSFGRIAEYFIPKAGAARKLLDQMRTDAPFLSIIPINVLASDGHTTARIGSLDEDADGRLHKQLAETIGFYQPFLVHILAKLREKYAATTESILDFLCESPLFAENRSGLLRDGLLAYEQEDFVKAIHVLVPQIEQILRNFLGNLGRPTLKTVRNHPGLMDAKSMNDILGDEQMRKVLTENLWRYLEVVYIDKRGLNLRNDLAHGLLSPNVFNRSLADRVFHTLLALSLMRAQNGGGQTGESAGPATV